MRDRIGRHMQVAWTVLLLGVVLAGCDDRPPSGQVLASVAGDDVTKRDLAVEAALTHVPPGQTTLNAIVDRKLLVRLAKRNRLDLTPDYLDAVRRFREATLATLAVQQATASQPPPGDAAVMAYAARRFVAVDDGGTHRLIDTALPAYDGDADRLLAAPVGATATIGGRRLTILGAEPANGLAANGLATARDVLVRRQRERVIRRLVAAERAAVRVRYQSGFGANP